MILSAFLLFLTLFFLVGLSSYWASKKNTQDYLVAGKSMTPSLVGLSAVATNNSGFMFIGMIGATYSMGLSSIWIMVGWIIGDWLVQRQAVQAIQTVGHDHQVHSFSGLITHWISRNNGLRSSNHIDNTHLANTSNVSSAKQGSSRSLRRLRQGMGVFTVIFLTVYAAAQLKAGSKATEVLLDWTPEMGVILAALLIFVYSLVGGLRASIWTDVAQSIVMLIGMASLVFFGVQSLGGVASFWQAVSLVPGGYSGIFPNGFGFFEAILFVVGWIAGGMGVLGQPHIVIRFMTLSDRYSAKQMQAYYYAWFITFYALTISAGLISRVLIPDLNDFDAELALPMLAENLMPEIFVGLLLAALFAATMSTVDSLVLSCSASLSRDLTAQPFESLLLTKLATAMVLVCATMLALSNNQTVFSLVLDAWGWLGSAFVPLIIWLSLGRKMPVNWAMFTILAGMSVFALFAYGGFLSWIYAITFGLLAGFCVLALYWLTTTLSEKRAL